MLISIDIETQNQATQSLLFAGAVILRRCLSKYGTDHEQNNLISDLDPFQSNCGQLSAFGDLQQNFQSASVVPISDRKGCFTVKEPGEVKLGACRHRHGLSP